MESSKFILYYIFIRLNKASIDRYSLISQENKENFENMKKFKEFKFKEGLPGWGNLFNDIKEKAIEAKDIIKGAKKKIRGTVSSVANKAREFLGIQEQFKKDNTVAYGKSEDSKVTVDTTTILGGGEQDMIKKSKIDILLQSGVQASTFMTNEQLDRLLADNNISFSETITEVPGEEGFSESSSSSSSSSSSTTTATTTTTSEEVVQQPKVVQESSSYTVVNSVTTSSSFHALTQYNFQISKKQIQMNVDPRYVVMRQMDDYMNIDNTIRFVATDTTDLESYALKLYFKGEAINGGFYSQVDDPSFQSSIDDCKTHKILMNRLYNRATINTLPINYKKEEPVYDDINLPKCVSISEEGVSKTYYKNIFTLPEGEKLSEKCLKGSDLNKLNSCFPYLRLVARGVLHAIKLLNKGNTYYKHGNISPANVYLLIKNDTQRVFLDNMLYENTKYDDVTKKPFKNDMNALGDTLIKVLFGTKSPNVTEPITSAFDLYHQVKKYFEKNNIDISIQSAALNINGLRSNDGKTMTRAEYEYKLQKSIFNFVYRLKCTGTSPTNQFMDIEQALNHDFIKSGFAKGNTAPGETWESMPADY